MSAQRDEPKLRLYDLRIVIELLVEAVESKDGARDRIATKYGKQKSVLTDMVHRVEEFFAAPLMCGPQRKSPTAAGEMLARRGPQLLDELEAFGELLRDANEREDATSI